MPRTVASNGVKPELRALSVISLNVPVTPEAINKAVGTGNYASKYILYLKLHFGFDFSVQKEGRKVVSYTCIKEPANVADLRKAPVVAAKVKAAVAAKSQPVVKNRSNLSGPKVKLPVNRKQAVAPQQVVDGFGNTADGEVQSFGVDRDWDAVDNVNLRDLGLDM